MPNITLWLYTYDIPTGKVVNKVQVEETVPYPRDIAYMNYFN